jgi:hypothetical protein
MPRPKKGERTPGSGRKKGVPNKYSRCVRQDVFEVFKKVGGVKKLAECAKEDPFWFFTQFYKPLIPKVIEGDFNHNLVNPILLMPNTLTPEEYKEFVKKELDKRDKDKAK